MRMWTTLAAICLTAACGPAGVAPSASATPAAATSTSAASMLPGSTFTMPTDRDMITFGADRGALIAFSTTDTLWPHESKVQRAEPITNAWRTVYRSDAMFLTGRIAGGRVALAEYREPYQGGGAYSVDFTVVDLATGAATAIEPTGRRGPPPPPRNVALLRAERSKTLEPARDVPAIGAAPEASDDALLWLTVIPSGRTLTLFRPRP